LGKTNRKKFHGNEYWKREKKIGIPMGKKTKGRLVRGGQKGKPKQTKGEHRSGRQVCMSRGDGTQWWGKGKTTAENSPPKVEGENMNEKTIGVIRVLGWENY